MKKLYLLFLTVYLLTGIQSFSQISLSGPAYTQDFNTLGNTAGTTTNALIIPGWLLTETGGGTRDNELYAVDNGASATGDTYSYGTTAAIDRALGGLQSGTLIPVIGASFTNNTGTTLNSLTISYTGEQWRLGALGRVDRMDFQYSLDATSLSTGTWTDVNSLDFTAPVTGPTVGALDGNAAANRTAISFSITGLTITNGATFYIRWTDLNATGSDDGLSVDDFTISTIPVNIISIASSSSAAEPSTNGSFTITFSPSTTGSTTFDYALTGTATFNNTPTTDYTVTLSGGATPSPLTTATGTITVLASTASVTLTITPTNDVDIEPVETIILTLTNPSGGYIFGTASATINLADDDATPTLIHDIQGSGNTAFAGNYTIQGIVTGVYPTLSPAGFYIQEEVSDWDANTLTSEGIFVVSAASVAVGDIVRVAGTTQEDGLSPSFNQAVIHTTTVLVMSTGNALPPAINLSLLFPVTAITDYEKWEAMLISIPGTLTVTDNNNLGSFGEVKLSSGGLVYQPTQIVDPNDNPASGTTSTGNTNGAAVTAYTLSNTLRTILLDDGRGGIMPSLPYVNVDNTLRVGSTIDNLSGILGFAFSQYRIQPTPNFSSIAFNHAVRPAVPLVGGNLKVVSFNVLNYFNGDGLGGGFPTTRGASSPAEFTRQRDKIIESLRLMNADVVGLIEMENLDLNNTTPALLDLVNGLNAVMGAGTYSFIDDDLDNSGGQDFGTDQIRCAIIYKSAVVTPVGTAMLGSDPVFDRPPLAQTFNLISTGRTFNFIVNHFKSKGGCPGPGVDADQLDGQACWNNRRKLQAAALLSFINATVIPTSGTTHVLSVGDYNAYYEEDPMDILRVASYTVAGSASSYSYLFDGQLGSLDHAVLSPSLNGDVTGIAKWNANSVEPTYLDYKDGINSGGGDVVNPWASTYTLSPWRASDHDAIIIGLLLVGPDIFVTKTDSPDPVSAGGNIAYTITVQNSGPVDASNLSLTDILPTNTTFVSLTAPAGWTSVTPAVGSTGTITATKAALTLAEGAQVFTLVVQVNPGTANGTIITNTASVTATESDPNPANNIASSSTTVSSPCIVTCPANITVPATGPSGAVVIYPAPTTSGSCGTITTLPPSGSTFPIGTTTVNAYNNASQKVYGLTTANSLVTFDITTPGTLSAPLAITGLQIGESILGIDVRPSTGVLFGLGSTSRIYTINIVTGAATQVGAVPFTPALSGTEFGMDFNPTVDRIRVVSNTGQNLRINPTTGANAAVDANLNPGTPDVVGVAYTNNYALATSTTLYDIDANTDALYIQTNPNGGVLALIGALGINTNELVGFDIAYTGIAYASLTGGATTGFYTINLATGAATLVGAIPGNNVRDITILTPVACSFTITVQDLCTLTCPANITVSNDPNQCGAVVTFPPATTTGSCGTVTASPASGSFFPVGTTTVTFTSTAGPSCTFTVTVNDTQAPAISCPANLFFQCASQVPTPNPAFVIVNDNCPGLITVIHVGDVITNQTCANRFTVTRTYRATDAAGNTADCSHTITVNDQTAPTLTCPAGTTVSCASQVPAANIALVTGVSDNCSGAVTVTHVGDVITNQTCANRFTLTRTYRATDACGNFAECTQIFTVNDQTAPTLTCPAGATVSCASQVPAANIALVTGVSDNCSGAVTVTHVGDVITNQTCANRFTLTRTYRATDVCGNFAQCTQVFTVNDQTAPVISCPSNMTVTTLVGSCQVAVNFTVTATDNCGGAVTINSVPASGSIFQIGTTTVVSTATDACGNVSTCTFTVTVLDGQLPVISTQPVNRTVCAGTNAIFSVTSTNAVSYQWQQYIGGTWTNITGQISSSMTLNAVTHSMNTNTYRVNVIGLCTTVTSGAASLYVNPLPTISLAASIPPILLPGQSLTITATVNPGGGSFIWFKNNAVISGATGSSLTGLTVDNIGTYKAEYTDLNGCKSTSADLIVSGQPSGNLYVYPNPSSGQFQVRFYNSMNEQATISIYDEKGARVYSRAFNTTIPYTSVTVDISRLAAGKYLVEVVNAAGKRIGSKWIVMVH